MKKTITIFTLACAVVLNLTACTPANKNSGDSEIDTSSSTLPVDTSRDDLEYGEGNSGGSTSSVGEDKDGDGIPDNDGTTSGGDTGKKPSGGGVAQLPFEEVLKLVPDEGAMMDDEVQLGQFIINGVMFDITEPDLTPTVIGETIGGNFGNWGLGYEDYDSDAWLGDEAGYYFYGSGFSYAGGSDRVHIEALDKDGELVYGDEWQRRIKSSDDILPFEDYEVKAVRFEEQSTPDFVHFIGGLMVGRQPAYYEEILGKGYEVDVDKLGVYDIHIRYKLSIYKTSTATMVLEYRENQGTWYNKSITVIKNDDID